LNRRMNETLEAMARAIFKDWFVDFGPTRAKMEGRAPYLAPDIWSLFPDRLDADGKPVGWTAESVYDQAIWVNGAAYKDMHFSSEPDALPVVKIAELKNGITKTTRFTNTDLGQRYKIVDGELLFSWSGNPDTSIDTFVWTSGTGWLNQHIFAVRPNGKRSQAFLYAMLKFLRSDFAEIARNKQTTGLGHVTQQDLIRLRITAPSEGAQAAFDDVVGPLHSRFISNLFENRSLIAARDFLIPKLMSGEIRVREAEKAVEAAQ
jgi:type I restriction enzyme S subunit